VNLWTVGCADPRLTARARSPMDKLGKTQCVSPALPTGQRLPTSFTAPRNKKRSIRFRGNGETISRLPAFSLCSPEAVQTTGTVAKISAFRAAPVSTICAKPMSSALSRVSVLVSTGIPRTRAASCCKRSISS